MYNEHFGLSRAPFRITPDTKMFYPGGNRGEILEALIYAISSGEGIVKVVGEVGSGKTMLCRMLEERLGDNVDVVYLANPSLSPEDTLHAIAMEMKLDVAPDANRLQVMHVLQERLLEKHADKRQVVVFIEEAQSMPIGTLEEIRLLSNLETNRDKLLQIVLFGQPELDRNLEQPEIRQLKERITHSFYLDPFSAEQMREYVNFRMRAVGYRGPDIFRGGAYRRLARASEGLTRRINILADKALLAAFAEDTFDVNKRHVKIAIRDSQFMRGRRWGLAEISLLSGLVLIGAALAYTLMRHSESIGETLGRWLPVAASEQVAAGAEDGEPREATVAAASMQSSGAAKASDAMQSSDTATQPAGGETMAQAGSTSAIVAEAADETPGAPTEAHGAARADGASDEGLVEARPAGARAVLPVAAGGSRLVLSEALSEPPRARAASGARTIYVPDANHSSEGGAASTEAASSGVSEDPVTVDAAGAGSAVVAAADANGMVSAAADPGFAPGDLGPLTEARLAATRAWLEAADDRHFSIQLLLTDFARRDNLERFLRERQAAGEVDDYYVFETRIRSNTWFGVLYKEYDSFSDAKAALEELPEEFRDHRPFIRNVRDIATLS